MLKSFFLHFKFFLVFSLHISIFLTKRSFGNWSSCMYFGFLNKRMLICVLCREIVLIRKTQVPLIHGKISSFLEMLMMGWRKLGLLFPNLCPYQRENIWLTILAGRKKNLVVLSWLSLQSNMEIRYVSFYDILNAFSMKFIILWIIYWWFSFGFV